MKIDSQLDRKLATETEELIDKIKVFIKQNQQKISLKILNQNTSSFVFKNTRLDKRKNIK